MQKPLISRPSGPLTGTLTPPGDKSISHRAVILGGIAEGLTTATGLLEGEDVLHTVAALRAMGAKIQKTGDTWKIEGAGLKGLHAPAGTLDMGNSGTAARLLIGLGAGLPFSATFDGDASLRKRPMKRVIEPLMRTGATFESADGRLPLKVTGALQPKPVHYRMPVASAQVKSAILLAGLSAEGTTIVTELQPTRDHSERMLRAFGAHIKTEKATDGSEAILLEGRPKLVGQNIKVPGDPSSAAFPLVAALLHPGSRVTLQDVGLNPRRTGLFNTLIEMGAKITHANLRDEGGEPVGDLIIEGDELKGVEVPAARAPSMIDEYPILAIAAACAKGTTRMRGLAELRVKESDRLALIADGLARCGAGAEIEGDDLIVYGTGKPPKGGVTIATAMDHRIAMSFLVLGSAAQEAVTVDDGGFIATSFPGFAEVMNGLGMLVK